MVVYHSWVQELFGGKRFQKFDNRQVSKTLADIWLAGMLQRGTGPKKVRTPENGMTRKQSNGAEVRE